MTRIMVIDDNPDFLDLMKELLESESFDVCLCKDAIIAVDTARAEAPHLIILDLIMPGKSGLEVLAELKTSSATCDIPVIVLSAASRQTDEAQLQLKRLADDRVAKPFDFDHLLSRIRWLLSEKEERYNAG